MNRNERQPWLDFVKGISALFVIMTHTPETPYVYRVLYSYIMLPSFFIVSGYLCKPNNRVIDFIYNRILKLIVLYCLYGFLSAFVSVGTIKLLLKNPSAVFTKLLETIQNIVMGKTLWFIACIIWVTIIFMILKAIAKNNDKILVTLSAIIGIAGFWIAVPERHPWSIDTALVCQMFYVCGYMINKHNVMNQIHKIGLKSLCCGVAYIATLVVGYIVCGKDAIVIVVGTNQWKVVPITIVAIIFGNAFIFLIAKMIGEVKFINYIGQHTLLYYVFGGHLMSAFNKMFNIIFTMSGISIFGNRYIINPLICIFTGLLMIIPCLIVDKYIPWLNGRFKMPCINSKKSIEREQINGE